MRSHLHRSSAPHPSPVPARGEREVESQASTYPATLTIDLLALRANWRLLANMVAPAECAAVVKANAYGIGLAEAARALAAEGARTFFVARLEEGIRLRALLPDITVYVLDGLAGEPDAFRREQLRPVLGTAADLALWREAGEGAPAAFHIDTGMNRLGFSPNEVGGINDVNLALVLSHFTSSERPDAVDNARQIALFDRLRPTGIPASLANSSGIFLPPRPWYNLVRPGYALYGGNPTPSAPNPMRPVVHLDAPVLQVRDVPTGATVGYNGQWTARRPSRIATLGLGYADGIPRGAAATDTKPGPEVAIEGRRCPIVGRVSMDLTTIDVTDVAFSACDVGTRVEVLGRTISVDEFGERAGTIGYEILTGLGRRYRRCYLGAMQGSA